MSSFNKYFAQSGMGLTSEQISALASIPVSAVPFISTMNQHVSTGANPAFQGVNATAGNLTNASVTSATMGNVVVTGSISIPNTSVVNLKATSTTVGTLVVTGSGRIPDLTSTSITTGSLIVNGSMSVDGIITINNNTESSTTADGCLITKGGAGIQKNLNVGGSAYVSQYVTAGNSIATNAGSSYHHTLTTGDMVRWRFGMEKAEAGANSGGNLVMSNYGDGGSYDPLGNPFRICRSTGFVQIGSNVTEDEAENPLQVKYTYSGGDLTQASFINTGLINGAYSSISVGLNNTQYRALSLGYLYNSGSVSESYGKIKLLQGTDAIYVNGLGRVGIAKAISATSEALEVGGSILVDNYLKSSQGLILGTLNASSKIAPVADVYGMGFYKANLTTELVNLNTSTGVLTVRTTNDSTSKASGAMIVAGGMGINSDCQIGGKVVVPNIQCTNITSGTLTLTTSATVPNLRTTNITTGSLIVTSSANVTGTVSSSGLTLTGNTNIYNSTCYAFYSQTCAYYLERHNNIAFLKLNSASKTLSGGGGDVCDFTIPATFRPSVSTSQMFLATNSGQNSVGYFVMSTAGRVQLFITPDGSYGAGTGGWPSNTFCWTV